MRAPRARTHSDRHAAAHSNTEKESAALASKLIARESRYRPYLLTYLKRTPNDQLERSLRQIVAHDPDHPVAETIRLGRARSKVLEAEQMLADRRGDLETILTLIDEARAELQALAGVARQDLVRVRAREALREMKTASAWSRCIASVLFADVGRSPQRDRRQPRRKRRDPSP